MNGNCPTCGGNGSALAAFDGLCPAAWAHNSIEFRTSLTISGVDPVEVRGRFPTHVPRIGGPCVRCGLVESEHSGIERFCPIIATYLPDITAKDTAKNPTVDSAGGNPLSKGI